MSNERHRALQELGTNNNVLLFPVTKTRRLPEHFPLDTAPVPLTASENNIQVASLVVGPLGSLLQAARGAGFSPHLTSGFRSINKQADIFDGWVRQETEAGLSHEDAVNEANNYSAKPGYSEHHLGTAVDILEVHNPEDDQEWNGIWDRARKEYNSGFYLWLRQSAHVFGFAISYPTGTNTAKAKVDSGYPSAEPWHLRYVGKIIAMELFTRDYLNPNSSITLNSFLEANSSI